MSILLRDDISIPEKPIKLRLKKRKWPLEPGKLRLEALLGGLVIGFCVSYFLFCSFDKLPTKNPILKSVTLSFIFRSVILSRRRRLGAYAIIAGIVPLKTLS
jgi:hypothetical protein